MPIPINSERPRNCPCCGARPYSDGWLCGCKWYPPQRAQYETCPECGAIQDENCYALCGTPFSPYRSNEHGGQIYVPCGDSLSYSQGCGIWDQKLG